MLRLVISAIFLFSKCKSSMSAHVWFFRENEGSKGTGTQTYRPSPSLWLLIKKTYESPNSLKLKSNHVWEVTSNLKLGFGCQPHVAHQRGHVRLIIAGQGFASCWSISTWWLTLETARAIWNWGKQTTSTWAEKVDLKHRHWCKSHKSKIFIQLC